MGDLLGNFPNSSLMSIFIICKSMGHSRNTRSGPNGSIYQDESLQTSPMSSRVMSPIVPINHETGEPKRSKTRRAIRALKAFMTNPYTLTLGVPLTMGAIYLSNQPKFKNALSSAYNFASNKFHKIQKFFAAEPINVPVPVNDTNITDTVNETIQDNYTKHTG